MARVPLSAVIALTLLVATAATGESSRAVLEKLALGDGAIELGLTRAVEPAVHRLTNPPRVYVDLKDTTLGARVARALEGSGPVKRVRLGQFDAATTRVVIELTAPTRLDVETTGSGLRLVVAGGEVAKPVAKPAPKRVPEPVATAPDVPRLLVVRADAPLETLARTEPALPTALQDRIARRAAADDSAGVVALYASDMRAVRDGADAATRAVVVDALRELGLVHAARKLLGPARPAEAPALRVARAELIVADGDTDEAAALVSGLDEGAVDPVVVPKLQRVRVRMAIARGDLDAAADGIGSRATPELRAELATAALHAGRTASEKRSCRRAVVAFRHALDADAGRTARAAAAAGLVRAALACSDPDATLNGLGVLAESPHPLLRRAATAIAKTQVDEKRPAIPAGRGG